MVTILHTWYLRQRADLLGPTGQPVRHVQLLVGDGGPYYVMVREAGTTLVEVVETYNEDLALDLFGRASSRGREWRKRTPCTICGSDTDEHSVADHRGYERQQAEGR